MLLARELPDDSRLKLEGETMGLVPIRHISVPNRGTLAPEDAHIPLDVVVY